MRDAKYPPYSEWIECERMAIVTTLSHMYCARWLAQNGEDRALNDA